MFIMPGARVRNKQFHRTVSLGRKLIGQNYVIVKQDNGKILAKAVGVSPTLGIPLSKSIGWPFVFGFFNESLTTHTLSAAGSDVIQDNTGTNVTLSVKTGECVIFSNRQDGTGWDVIAQQRGVSDAIITFTDITTNNVSITKHGFYPKLDNTATHFMDSTGVQRALAASDVPVFVASGGSHAAGEVPDPGATAFAHTQRVLTDQATFAISKGQVLGYNYVSTDESTASASFVDLTTADSVTFTLDAAQDLLIEYRSYSYTGTANTTNDSQVFLDGAGQTTSKLAQTMNAATNAVAHMISFKMSAVASGAHTIKVEHLAENGQTAHWFNRALKVSILA